MNWPSKFFYSGTAMMLVLFYPSLLLAGLAEAKTVDFSSNYRILSFCYSICQLVLCLMIFISVFILNFKNYT